MLMILQPLEARLLMAAYVVSPTGADTNAGTDAAPWQTLQHAALKVQAGDTVTVRPGQYVGFCLGWETKPVGTQDSPITFKADKGAVITARNNKTADGINIENSGFVVIDGFEIANAKDTGRIDRAGVRIANSPNSAVRNVNSHDNGTWGIYVSHSDDVAIENNIAASNNAIRPDHWNHHGIYVSNSSQRPIVKGNTVSDNLGNGIHVNGDASQGGAGVVVGAVIENNTVTGNGKNGGSAINCDGIQNSQIKNNTLTDNHAKGISLYQTDAGAPSSGNVVEGNTITMASDCGRPALLIRNGSINNTVQGNTLASPAAAIAIAKDSLTGFKADKNTYKGKFSVDNDESTVSFAKWKETTGQDANSTADEPISRKKAAVVIFGALAAFGFAIACAAAWVIRRRNFHKWLGTYIRTRDKRRPIAPGEDVHVLICIADHYEPGNDNASKPLADNRVARWCTEYPRLFSRFADSDGRPPRHTFFYPLEQYNPSHVEQLADLCRAGFGEVEVHLHHDKDNSSALRDKLDGYKQLIASKHNLLGRDRRTGEIRYGFVHGDWALDNSHPLGHNCGVNDELTILRTTGCYADFTLPAAPDPSQIAKINSIYYAVDDPNQPCSHADGTDVGIAPQPRESLMLIQGPLLLDWKNRKIENSCIQGSQPPTMERLNLWLKARVHVPKRPDWLFVKLHTHGCPEENASVLLGDPMVKFHEALAARAARDSHFHYHYVTAREMYNCARAAEAGFTGSVSDARDFEILAPSPRTRGEGPDFEQLPSRPTLPQGVH